MFTIAQNKGMFNSIFQLSDIAGPVIIDAITAFIMGGKTISDLTMFTPVCNPDISSDASTEPITIAAEQALQKLKSTS